MIEQVDKVDLDSSECVQLDPCYEQAISNQFTLLKTTTQTQQTAFINNSTITDTASMITLRDSVYANSQQSVNDAMISVDPECQTSFGQSVCDAITCFKAHLYGEIKLSVEKGNLSINDVDMPIGVSKFELKKMLDILIEEIKKKLTILKSSLLVASS